jgi:ABC-type oligopeptide transport system substrate-binding subunit
VLRWGVAGLTDVPTLDPALASDPTSISVASLIYGGLVRLDAHLRVVPDGAKRWTISRDGKTYTFFLRSDLRFASGQQATASDFAAALLRAESSEGSSGPGPFYLGLIRQANKPKAKPGIQVINKRTLRITLVRPAAHFLAQLAFPVAYVPDPTVMAHYGANWTDHAAGFGPYYVKVWRHSRYLTLRPNRHYYGYHGSPPIKTITLHFYQQEQSAIAAYQRGALDLVSGLAAGGALSTQVTGVQRLPGLALDYLAYNTVRQPFLHIGVRRALATAWSPKLVTQAMGSTAFPSTGFLPSVFGIKTLRWQPSRSAAAYLARGHYPHGRGFPRIALIMPRDPYVFKLAQALTRSWSRTLGIQIVPRQLNLSTYTSLLNAHNFDLAIIRWGADYPDPQDFLYTQLGSSSDNVTGWSRRSYGNDVSLADSYSPLDPRRAALYRDAARIAALNMAILPLDEPAVTAVISPKLAGVDLTPLGTVCGDWPVAHFTS